MVSSEVMLCLHVQKTLKYQSPGITILNIFLEMLLTALQYHLMFLLKAHVVSAVATYSTTNRKLF